ncbi:Altronate dehydratase (EC [Olavius algarvensis Delta 1 endosymbiont]|nr:Altronate dehydratase (EC [Olavius algarvensis Delta 1 endosymbiont]
MERTAIAIKEQDNVATAIKDIPSGQEAVVGVGEQTLTITVIQDIAYGHKFALRAIAKGEAVLKYSCVIGRATCNIEPGQHTHVHNLESLRGRGDLDLG